MRSGEALGALILPADATERLQDALNLGGTKPPEVEVLYNAEDPSSAATSNRRSSRDWPTPTPRCRRTLTTVAAKYIGIVTAGGDISLFGRKIAVLGLQAVGGGRSP